MGKWQRRCKNMVEFCEAAAWSVDPETVYQSIVDTGVTILDCDWAHLHLLTIDGDRFVRHASRSDEQAIIDGGWEVLPADVGRLRWMMRSHLSVFMDYARPNSEDYTSPVPINLGYKSAVCIPLLAADVVLGIFTIMYKCDIPYSEADQEYLLGIGRVLGVLIQRVQKARKDAELQILNERKRLGAEIHDNLSQIISALSISADTMMMAYEEDPTSEAFYTDLKRLDDVTHRTMKVLRSEMISLLTPLEQTEGLLEGIKESLSRFESQWGITISFKLTAEEPVIVPMQTALQLVRILNECLSNILNHAEATHIDAALEEDQHRLILSVRDNGHGFDINAVSPERLGLHIMHERATAANGKLTIESDERGTLVCVKVPKTL